MDFKVIENKKAYYYYYYTNVNYVSQCDFRLHILHTLGI